MGEPSDYSTEAVAEGLSDARATLAEIWRRCDDDERRKRCMRALQAVIQAEHTMQAADAFLRATTRSERAAALEELRKVAIFRVGPLAPNGGKVGA